MIRAATLACALALGSSGDLLAQNLKAIGKVPPPRVTFIAPRRALPVFVITPVKPEPDGPTRHEQGLLAGAALASLLVNPQAVLIGLEMRRGPNGALRSVRAALTLNWGPSY